MEEIRLIDAALVRSLLRERPETAHKGTMGHALLIAGSPERTGAAILASKAAMRAGCGLLTLHIAAKAATAVLAHLPEAMILPRKKKVQRYPDYGSYQAVGFGPGAGLDRSSDELLFDLLKFQRGPLVLDADGITLLGRNRSWYDMIGGHIILTPHPGEFDRLTDAHSDTEDRFRSQVAFATGHGVNVLVKGPRTRIVTATGMIYENTSGNSGMATAGSGDVLTGIITSLCAQGYPVDEAAVIGVWLHGHAGDLAAAEYAKTAMLASDIISCLPACFRSFGL